MELEITKSYKRITHWSSRHLVAEKSVWKIKILKSYSKLEKSCPCSYPNEYCVDDDVYLLIFNPLLEYVHGNNTQTISDPNAPVSTTTFWCLESLCKDWIPRNFKILVAHLNPAFSWKITKIIARVNSWVFKNLAFIWFLCHFRWKNKKSYKGRIRKNPSNLPRY